MFLRLPFAAFAVARVDERCGEWMDSGERAEPSATADDSDTDGERERERRGRLDGMEWVLGR